MAHARKLESFTEEFRTLVKTVKTGNPVTIPLPDRRMANKIRQDVSSLRLTYEKMMKQADGHDTRMFWHNEFLVVAAIEVIIREDLPGQVVLVMRNRGDNPAMQAVAQALGIRAVQLGQPIAPLNSIVAVGGVALPEPGPAPANIATAVMAVSDEDSMMDKLISMRTAPLPADKPLMDAVPGAAIPPL